MVGSLFVACSDDKGGGGVAGTAGTAGAGGSAGLGGSGGAGGTGGTGGTGNGGTASTAGSGGTAGTSGTGGSGSEVDAGDAGVTGLLEVQVSVTDENQLSPFNIDLGGTALADFSEGTLTFRIRADDFGDSVGVVPFVNDDNFSFQGGTFFSLNAANGAGSGNFVDVTFDVGALGLPPDAGDPDPADFDSRVVRVIGIQIGSGGGYVSPNVDAGADAGADVITVFIDSITFNGVDGITNFEFTNDAQGFVLNTGFGNQNATVTHLD
ncbi:MAG: hypothetical protein ABW217_04285 [Polyangiaceae bacterium]